jgi:hypothetical protein
MEVTVDTQSPAKFSWNIRLVWLLLCAVQVAPIWLNTWLPMGDLGGHLDLMDVMARYDDANTIYAATYDLPHGANPNTVTLYVARWFPFLGAAGAAKVLLSLYLVGVPWSLSMLARAFGRSPWLALLSLPLSWNALVNVGFLNYIIAFPLLFCALALARTLAEHGGWKRMIGLGACLVTLFFCHAIAFLIGLGMTVVVLVAWLPSARFAWRLVALAPVLPLLLVWVKRKFIDLEATEAGRTFGGGGLELVHLSWPDLIKQIPQWGMQYFRDDSDDNAFWMVCALWLVAMVWGTRQLLQKPPLQGSLAKLRNWGLELITLVCMAAYFVVPSHMAEMDIITERIVVQVLFLLCLWPRVDFSGRSRWLLAPMALLALGFPVVVQNHFAQFEREEVGGLPAALNQLPDKSRLSYVMWVHDNKTTFMGPLWHLPRAIFLLQHGGLTDESFAARPYTAIQYKKGKTPPKLPRDFWNSSDLFGYDAVLLRSTTRPNEAIAHRALELKFAEGEWWLFGVRPAFRNRNEAKLVGGGGNRLFVDCPQNEVVAGIVVQTTTLVEGVRPMCQRVPSTAAPVPHGSWLGATGRELEAPRLVCPQGTQANGIFGRSANVIDAIGLICGDQRTAAAGGSGGEPFEVVCPAGQKLVGLQARVGALVDAIGVQCE